ncbi:MAG: hypothetical protein J5365_06335 [Erysipelotrichaceae bacterium]|nr:hypothetical protein [Erysipelotrichaceae bacterium]
MKHTIKKIITMMLAIVMAMGIMAFERKTVDAAITEVTWDHSVWGIINITGTSFSTEDVTMNVSDGVGFAAFDELAHIFNNYGGAVTFTANEGKGNFMSITIVTQNQVSDSPEGWTAKGGSFIWTGESDTVAFGVTSDIRLIERIIFVMSTGDLEPEPDLVLNVTPPKCGVSITSGVGWSTPSPEVEFSGNYILVHAYYFEGNMPFNGIYEAGEDFYIDICFYPKDASLVDGSDVVISLNEGIEIIEDDYVYDDGSMRFSIKGKVGSDCEVEPDPTPTPEPDPTPDPTPVPIPKTGVDAADPYVLFRNISLLGVCLIGSVLFITKKK